MRWWVLAGPLGSPDLDEATVGVQAFEFGHGRLSVFFPNQPYGGTLEPGLVRIGFWIFGSGVLVLKMVPILCCLATAWLAWRTAIRLGLTTAGQLCVPVMAWCGPAYLVVFSTKERAFYGVASVLAMSYPLLVLRLDREITRRDVIVLGLCLGLGWWQTPLIVAVAAPSLLWLVVRRPAVLRWTGWAVGAAALGALPWLVWNARHGWRSVDAGSDPNTSWLDRIEDFWSRLGVVTGIETPFNSSRALIGWRWAGATLVIGVLVVATLRTRRQAPGFLALMVVGYSVLYGLNSLALLVGPDPRYLFLVLPILALCVGAVIPDPSTEVRRFGLVVAVTVGTVGLSVWGTTGMADLARSPDANRFLGSDGIEEVAQLLEHRGVTTALTDLAGSQISYLSNERVIASTFAAPRLARYEEIPRLAPRSTYVLDRSVLGNDKLLRDWLQANKISFEERTVGKWAVFFVDGQVLPEQVPLRYFYGVVSAPS